MLCAIFLSRLISFMTLNSRSTIPTSRECLRVGGSTSDGTPSYTAQIGVYSRIGNIVNANFDIQVNGAISATGSLRVKGLPYACGNNRNTGFIESSSHSLASLASIYPRSVISQSYFALNYNTTSSNTTLTNSNVSSNFRVRGSIVYNT